MQPNTTPTRAEFDAAIAHLWQMVRTGRGSDGQRLSLESRSFILKVLHLSERALERQASAT